MSFNLSSIKFHQNISLSNDEAHRRVQEIVQHGGTLALVLAITMIVALIGNLFLMYLIIKMSHPHMSPVQILILHTCVADISFALCTVMPQMASLLTFPYFYGGDLLCRLVKYCQLIPMFASPFLLVAISTDRYVAVCKPLLALKWKFRLVRTLASAAWIGALIFSTPNIFAFRYDLISNTSVMACTFQMDVEFEKAWIGLFSLVAWLAPSIIVGTLYTFVCMAVWKSMRQNGKYIKHQREDPSVVIANGHKSKKSSPNSKSLINASSTAMRKNMPQSINHYKIKTVKLTMTIVVANFTLWAPFCITNVISTYFREIEIDDVLTTCIMLVGNANSCVNPWIYVVFNYKRVIEILLGNDPRQENSRSNQGKSSAATANT